MDPYLIIGQGMAGSTLAWELLRRGVPAQIVDDGHRTSASRAAAGMVNPVQGQRLNTAWNLDTCLPVAISFYQEMEETFGGEFFRPSPILRLIDNDKEQGFLDKRREDPRFAPYLGETLAPGAHGPDINDDRGSLFIHSSGTLDANALLDAFTAHFRQRGILTQDDFAYEQLSFTEDRVRWRDIEARAVIFAEGFRVLENPWLRDFNFQSNKGQILTLSADRPFPPHPVNRGKWIIPQADGTAWAGSTYGRGLTDLDLTAEGRDDILGKVKKALPRHTFTVADHRAGIRCTTGDHVPRAGFHPEHPLIAVFNGFGSKGNIFIPWLAQCFADHLAHGAPLPVECDFRVRPPRKRGQPR